MMRFFASCTCALACTVALAACAGDETSPLVEAPSEDAAVQVDAGTKDGSLPNDPDTGVADAAAPTAPPLECSVEPCFTRVSGEGSSVVCALTTTGTVWCWGSDGQPDSPYFPSVKGALGRGVAVTDPIVAATPMPIPSFDAVTQISIGRGEASCALRGDGSIWCWGTSPETGYGNAPAKVEGIAAAAQVVVDRWLACAVLEKDRSAWCWGQAGSPFMGEGFNGGPTRVPRVSRPVRSIGLGIGRSFGDALLLLTEGGSIVSWGSAPGRPSSLPGGRDWGPADIDAVSRGQSVGALRFIADGRAYAWGDYDGDLVARTIPRLDGSKVVDLGDHVAVDAKGDVFAWGNNTSGELGDEPDRLTRADAPVRIEMPAKARSVASANGAFCASLVDGSIVCWGRNLEGQLGRRSRDGSPHPRPERIMP